MERSVEKIPTWALMYLEYGDASGLTDEDLEVVNAWIRESHLQYLGPLSYDEYFSHYPAFGKPCDVMDCVCLISK